MTTKPTKVQIAARVKGFTRLLDSPGGSEALTALLIEHLNSDTLFDVLKGQSDKGADLFNTYDAVKTWCELDNDGDPWRLVRQSEIIDEEKHINMTDKDAVFEAAAGHHFLIFEDEASAHDNCWYESSDPNLPKIIIEAEPFSDTLGQLIAKQCAEDTYECEALASWFELYGLELHRRGSRVA